MTVNFKFGILLVVASVMLGAIKPKMESEPTAIKTKLSEYYFFAGNISDLRPASNVFPYEVNAALFSDYAEKARFIYLPDGQKMEYDPKQSFAFPTGAVIIKNFFYWNDVRSLEKGRRILETRLLLKEAKGWKALEYIWNTEQAEAFLEVTGATMPVSWLDENGKKQSIEYIAPNLNQCKGCHSFDGNFIPIGITARQLNRTENNENQLIAWQKAGRLVLPENFDLSTAPKLVEYTHSDQQLTSLRARSYLDANCAHCHNPHGPASTSGMFLEVDQTDLEKLGVNKPPVAAGRGSGNRRFGIVPGKPNESILVFRMESDDPGIRMPELGRQLAHREGLELVKEWIREMK